MCAALRVVISFSDSLAWGASLASAYYIVSYSVAAAVVAMFFLVARFVTGTKSWNPLRIAESQAKSIPSQGGAAAPKPLSASKLQFWIWTLVVLASYASISAARMMLGAGGGKPQSMGEIPIELILLMGLTATTAIGSKGISIGYLSRGDKDVTGGGAIGQPGSDGTSLSKLQMLSWSILGATIYLIQVVTMIGKADPSQLVMPPVDGALLVLTGISQGTYLGGKVIPNKPKWKPEIRQALPDPVHAGENLIIIGARFGNAIGQSIVEFNGIPITKAVSWSDFKIIVTVPPIAQAIPNATVRVIIGQTDSNTVTVSALPTSVPTIESIEPQQAKAKTAVTLTGNNFGESQADGAGFVTLNSAVIEAVSMWTDKKIVFNVPDDATKATSVPIRVRIGSQWSEWGQIDITG